MWHIDESRYHLRVNNGMSDANNFDDIPRTVTRVWEFSRKLWKPYKSLLYVASFHCLRQLSSYNIAKFNHRAHLVKIIVVYACLQHTNGVIRIRATRNNNLSGSLDGYYSLVNCNWDIGLHNISEALSSSRTLVNMSSGYRCWTHHYGRLISLEDIISPFYFVAYVLNVDQLTKQSARKKF